MIRYVLAVDGGGSKTAARLVAGGTVLAEAKAGPCNLYRDAEAGLAAVREACRAACAEAGLDLDRITGEACLSAGLAGITAAGAVGAARRALADFAAVRLSTDGYVAFVGALAGAPGSLLSVGTGVVAYRLHADGVIRRLSGWGFPVGDRGGGAWLGLRLVADLLEIVDGHAAVAVEGELAAVAAAFLGNDRGASLSRLRTAGPADFATLAPVIARAAGRGDGYASALLDEATGHLLRLARALSPSTAEPLVLRGGLAGVMAPRLVAAGLAADALARDLNGTPLDGAVLIAAGDAPAEFAPGDGEEG